MLRRPIETARLIRIWPLLSGSYQLCYEIYREMPSQLVVCWRLASEPISNCVSVEVLKDNDTRNHIIPARGLPLISMFDALQNGLMYGNIVIPDTIFLG